MNQSKLSANDRIRAYGSNARLSNDNRTSHSKALYELSLLYFLVKLVFSVVVLSKERIMEVLELKSTIIIFIFLFSHILLRTHTLSSLDS